MFELGRGSKPPKPPWLLLLSAEVTGSWSEQMELRNGSLLEALPWSVFNLGSVIPGAFSEDDLAVKSTIHDEEVVVGLQSASPIFSSNIGADVQDINSSLNEQFCILSVSTASKWVEKLIFPTNKSACCHECMEWPCQWSLTVQVREVSLVEELRHTTWPYFKCSKCKRGDNFYHGRMQQRIISMTGHDREHTVSTEKLYHVCGTYRVREMFTLPVQFGCGTLLQHKSNLMVCQATRATNGKFFYSRCYYLGIQFAQSIRLQGLFASECGNYLRISVPWDPCDRVHEKELKKLLWFMFYSFIMQESMFPDNFAKGTAFSAVNKYYTECLVLEKMPPWRQNAYSPGNHGIDIKQLPWPPLIHSRGPIQENNERSTSVVVILGLLREHCVQNQSLLTILLESVAFKLSCEWISSAELLTYSGAKELGTDLSCVQQESVIQSTERMSRFQKFTQVELYLPFLNTLMPRCWLPTGQYQLIAAQCALTKMEKMHGSIFMLAECLGTCTMKKSEALD